MLEGRWVSLLRSDFQKCVSQLEGGLRGQQGRNSIGEEKDTASEGQRESSVLLGDGKSTALPCERQRALYCEGG